MRGIRAGMATRVEASPSHTEQVSPDKAWAFIMARPQGGLAAIDNSKS